MGEETDWFYEKGGERVGPVPAREMLDLHRRGAIAAGTLVWRAGLADWTPFAATELAPGSATFSSPPALPPAPPPVPRQIAPFVPREARLRADFKPSLRRCYGLALEAFKARFWPLVGCYTLTSLMLSTASALYVPLLFLAYPLMGGLCWYILVHLRGKEPNLEMLFEGFRRQFGPLAILNLVVAGISLLLCGFAAVVLALLVPLAMGATGGESERVAVALVVGGSVLASLVLVLPILIVWIVGHFATLLILDCEIPAGRALALAWQATKPHLAKLLLILLVNGLLSFAGMLALYVGLFVTGTWATVALVQIYEDAFGDAPGGANA